MMTLGRVALVTAALVSVLGLVTCTPDGGSAMDGLVDIGTHKLYIRCTGEGSPVVVIDAGLGEGSAQWGVIQDQLAQTTRTCTYDRAGYGASEPGPMPRDAERAAAELERLLANAGIRGPYVLVGHSLGGLNAQVFAARYPDLVAGMVLLDPAPVDFISGRAFPELSAMAEQMTAEYRRMAEELRGAPDPDAQRKADFAEAVASEHEAMFGAGAAQVAGITSFGDTPLLVVGAGQPNPAFGDVAEAFQQFWVEQNSALATKSGRGAFTLIPESSHNLHQDAPVQIVDAIRETVEQIRRE